MTGSEAALRAWAAAMLGHGSAGEGPVTEELTLSVLSLVADVDSGDGDLHESVASGFGLERCDVDDLDVLGLLEVVLAGAVRGDGRAQVVAAVMKLGPEEQTELRNTIQRVNDDVFAVLDDDEDEDEDEEEEGDDYSLSGDEVGADKEEEDVEGDGDDTLTLENVGSVDADRERLLDEARIQCKRLQRESGALKEENEELKAELSKSRVSRSLACELGAISNVARLFTVID